jgi:hypothetical protein
MRLEFLPGGTALTPGSCQSREALGIRAHRWLRTLWKD